jgi:chaperonin GroES
MKIQELKPVRDRIAVVRDDAEEMSPGGILLPGKDEPPQTGKVLSIGEGTKDVTITAKPGDRVLFGKYSGQEVEVGDQTVLLMRWDDVLAVLE